MSRGLPSMTALLGLLAVAGYQNRDKLAGMFGGASGSAPAGNAGNDPQASHQPGWLDGIFGRSEAPETGRGSVVSGGLGELVDRFRQSGHSETADSWVGTGPNREVAPHQLQQAIGPDVLADLSKQTGLSQDELLSRLSQTLPAADDKMTPQGRVPSHEESAHW